MEKYITNLFLYKSEYELGDMVYLKTDEDKNVRIITGIKFYIGGSILYTLCLNTTESMHYGIEFSYEKSYINY